MRCGRWCSGWSVPWSLARPSPLSTPWHCWRRSTAVLLPSHPTPPSTRHHLPSLAALARAREGCAAGPTEIAQPEADAESCQQPAISWRRSQQGWSQPPQPVRRLRNNGVHPKQAAGQHHVMPVCHIRVGRSFRIALWEEPRSLVEPQGAEGARQVSRRRWQAGGGAGTCCPPRTPPPPGRRRRCWRRSGPSSPPPPSPSPSRCRRPPPRQSHAFEASHEASPPAMVSLNRTEGESSSRRSRASDTAQGCPCPSHCFPGHAQIVRPRPVLLW